MNYHVCNTCRHYRQRARAELHHGSELQTAGGLKAYGEWQQREKQHAEREAQLMAAGGAFTYEPRHYAWCRAFTPTELLDRPDALDEATLDLLMQEGRAVMNPVTGVVAPVYAVCVRVNARLDCQRHEPR